MTALLPRLADRARHRCRPHPLFVGHFDHLHAPPGVAGWTPSLAAWTPSVAHAAPRREGSRWRCPVCRRWWRLERPPLAAEEHWLPGARLIGLAWRRDPWPRRLGRWHLAAWTADLAERLQPWKPPPGWKPPR